MATKKPALKPVTSKSTRGRGRSSSQAGSSARSRAKSGPKASSFKRVARPDVVDFRDLMFTPTLVEVPVRMPLDEYKKVFPRGRVPVLDQGEEGACTGFGLAAVANYLLHKRKVDPDRTLVSPHMLYEMAKRYDEWAGVDYEGSSARGAVKAWHKHGVCSDDLWHKARLENENHAQAVDAARRPLGAYFRVNHRDLVSMHAALTEVGALYATATVHTGWDRVGSKDGRIPFEKDDQPTGGHAFAVVGYDELGFWIQNSWGPSWGRDGFAHVSYADWLKNATDVWVTRLGAPVVVGESTVKSSGAAQSMASNGYTLGTLRPHIVGVGNDGQPRKGGELGTTQADIERIFTEEFPRLTKGWKSKRILFYSHGGLVGEKSALQRVEDYRQALLDNEIYPVAFIWRTDAWNTVKNLLSDVFRSRRAEGVLDATKDFMLDRIDDSLEVLAAAPGGLMWEEMKENAIAATVHAQGAARVVLEQLRILLGKHPQLQVHLAAHSAGSILLGPFVEAITTPTQKASPQSRISGLGAQIQSCTLWAPACTVELFKSSYLPSIKNGSIDRFSLFTLKEPTEQDDHCARIYNKSLLYLVSNAFELDSPLDLFDDGKPILGMEKFILKAAREFGVDAAVVRRDNPSEVSLFGASSAAWIRCPNTLSAGDPSASEARHHGDFDDDPHTVQATLARILGHTPQAGAFHFDRSSSALAERRRRVEQAFQET